jgi:prevent-host-death family protein
MDEMSIEAARPKLGEIVDRVRFTGQPTRITRQGKRAVVVVSDEWYEQAKALIAAAEEG